jgi:hypothetical protein
MDDICVWRKKGIGFYFFEGEGDRFLTERTSYFLEREEFLGRGVLDKVDVGKPALGRSLLVYLA